MLNDKPAASLLGLRQPELSATTGRDAVCCGVCARSSTDRAFDYGSKGWGFESLRARSFETATHKALTGYLLVRALCVGEDQLTLSVPDSGE
jgi:hypothetical protein